jgi:hypothetical protein
MNFDLEKSVSILRRTPQVFKTMLVGLHDDWIRGNEGADTFSPFDIIGHLIHGEETDWPNRVKMILEFGTTQTFVPYDRFAMYELSKGKSLGQLLDEFEIIRAENVEWLLSLDLSQKDLEKKGVHPKFGEVTLQQLLSTWVVHDLTHLAQASRVMAKQYKDEIGPWTEFFRILSY